MCKTTITAKLYSPRAVYRFSHRSLTGCSFSNFWFRQGRCNIPTVAAQSFWQRPGAISLKPVSQSLIETHPSTAGSLFQQRKKKQEKVETSYKTLSLKMLASIRTSWCKSL